MLVACCSCRRKAVIQRICFIPSSSGQTTPDLTSHTLALFIFNLLSFLHPLHHHHLLHFCPTLSRESSRLTTSAFPFVPTTSHRLQRIAPVTLHRPTQTNYLSFACSETLFVVPSTSPLAGRQQRVSTGLTQHTLPLTAHLASAIFRILIPQPPSSRQLVGASSLYPISSSHFIRNIFGDDIILITITISI